MLKSFGGAHGQPDGAALHPWRECTLAAMSSRRIPKTSLYTHPGLSYIAAGHSRPRPLKPDASKSMHARRVASRVRQGSQRCPFSASRAWCVLAGSTFTL